MILPMNFQTYPDGYVYAAALYLDGYITDDHILHLPKRQRTDVTNVKRLPHLPAWTSRLHTQYRKLPDTIDLEQFVILDDGWAAATLDLVRTKYPSHVNVAARVMFYMWERILFWGQYSHRPYLTGFVTTAEYVSQQCHCDHHFANKVILSMLDAGLIHRKWTGNLLTHRGSCYLAGPADSLERLLEKSNIES